MFNKKIIEIDRSYDFQDIKIEDELHRNFLIRIKRTMQDKYVWILLSKKSTDNSYQLIAYGTKQYECPQDAQHQTYKYIIKYKDKTAGI